MQFPILYKPKFITDSEELMWNEGGMVGVPLPPHVGAFGVKRKHHIHEGIDLYCPDNTPVLAIEGGRVVAVDHFTGEEVNSPWWEDTKYLVIKGKSGYLLYGEISPIRKVGDLVVQGQHIGNVKRVLKKDKGRPMSMLHLEWYTKWKGSPWIGEDIDSPPPYMKNPALLFKEYTVNLIDAKIIYACPNIEFLQYEDGVSYYKADVIVSSYGRTSAASITDRSFDVVKEKAQVGNIIQI